MESRQALESLLTEQLVSRGLRPVRGQLAFEHKGQVVSLQADATIYRGDFIAVLDHRQKVREFRSRAGTFDWDAIAAAIVDVAERRWAPQSAAAKADAPGAGSRPFGADFWAMLGGAPPAQLSVEPCQDKPGRVRVKLQELDLDPVVALQLCAAVSRALSPAM